MLIIHDFGLLFFFLHEKIRGRVLQFLGLVLKNMVAC